MAADALSSSGGRGVSRELPETEPSSSMVIVEVRDVSYLLW